MSGDDGSGGLAEYQRKRSFDKTPEPRGRRQGKRRGEDAAPRFVVQEHHARRLHWDLRLEHDGVLASWALPRGFPRTPEENRLAVHTEDHPLEYLTFDGQIPAGEYGGGSMTIWDHGTYVAEKFQDDKVVVHLHGEQVDGRFALFRTKGDDWMIHRMDTSADDGDPMPESLTPMAATLSTLPPHQDDWGFEIKWDGVRALAFGEPGRLRLIGRNGREFSRQYPELRPLMNTIGAHRMVLDGEIVAFDENGRPSFQRIQPRIHLSSEADIRRQAQRIPVVYVVFDLLYLDGRSLLNRPYEERRRELAALELAGPAWQVPDYQRGDGDVLLDATRKRGLEGIVAKRLAGPYRPGRRGGDWLKIKNVRQQEVVIGGWVPGQGRLTRSLGALLVGYYDDDALRFAGKVGTGFDDATRARLLHRLEELRTDESPFTGRQPQRDAVFVRPELVAEVEFAEWTNAGTLRHPSFEGLREDKPARDVVREEPVPPPGS
ncbi:DNA ligase [Jiangella aurantiaca]|uniref:DNA ligase (ATP) n=1 Tax=Jiangella aurantiaca TaxID=2530373 RepID=A0A4R5A938_9ACTN|nr:non-homologous end-joining DNA ligase [Jiangella aurantiaca]TDD67379.1 DNA ligase [Jiangella aurantiaca]